MTTDELNFVAESGAGQLYDTGDDSIYVCRLSGDWYEMGRQYGTFANDKVQPLWDLSVKPTLDKGWMTEADALATFGTRVFEASSTRRQAFYRGVAEGLGWPVDKTVLLDQSAIMGFYQSKLHSFSGCTSLSAWGEAAKDGHVITGRNLDWGEPFCEFPLFFAVYRPTDGSNAVANINWAGWSWAESILNDKGVYTDMHDGTSMGGQVVSVERSSLANSMFDWMLDSASARAIGYRFNSTRTDVPFIWGIADASGSTLCVCNSFMNPDWGLHKRDTVSHSLERYKNLSDRAAESLGEFDAAKMMEIFDLRLFNEDGTFKKDGGATKPTKQDADLTNYQIVTDLNEQQVWLKIPQAGKGDWRHVDLKAMFTD
jgi:hypothetical protein